MVDKNEAKVDKYGTSTLCGIVERIFNIYWRVSNRRALVKAVAMLYHFSAELKKKIYWTRRISGSSRNLKKIDCTAYIKLVLGLFFYF